MLTRFPASSSAFVVSQRLLARDLGEAAVLIEQQIQAGPPRSVYDALLLPALNYAEHDRSEARLTPDEEEAVIGATRELLSDTAFAIHRAEADCPGDVVSVAATSVRVLGHASNGFGDELALAMLAQAVDDLPISLEISSGGLLAAELVSRVREQGINIICFVDLPPSAPSRTRYLTKRLRAAMPGLQIVVGRWAPAPFADDSAHALQSAGATLVATTLDETRRFLEGLLDSTPRLTAARDGTDAA